MRVQDVLAGAIESNKDLVGRYLVGFDESNGTRQPEHLPNHLVWNLGHLAATMHRVAEKLDGKGFPESDFAAAAEGAGQKAGRFWIESVSFGSKPGDDKAKYPGVARSRQIFDAACDRLAAAAKAASDQKLSEQVPWGQGQLSLWLVVLRMNFHNGMHTGQIADLRRAMGFKSIFA